MHLLQRCLNEPDSWPEPF